MGIEERIKALYILLIEGANRKSMIAIDSFIKNKINALMDNLQVRDNREERTLLYYDILYYVEFIQPGSVEKDHIKFMNELHIRRLDTSHLIADTRWEKLHEEFGNETIQETFNARILPLSIKFLELLKSIAGR